ncbi:uncharacterized protein LOC141620126 [Silene latifolia]|uniref:uncharacterized protein LOC141620126 n=1 Tax=Silene latifolia TaxID=37657 RepID=UPI003D789BE0
MLADHLSRLHLDDQKMQRIGVVDGSLPHESLYALRVTEPWYANLVNYMVTKKFPTSLSSSQRNKIKADARFYIWDDPYLWKMCQDQVIHRCVPDVEIPPILKHCHEYACGGHFVPQRTARKILECGFYWPNIFKDAHIFIKTCDRCQRFGNISHWNEMPQQPMLYLEVFDVWGIDFMGPFPSSYGYLYILLAVDYVSKWVEVIPTKSDDAKTLSAFVKNNIFSRFGFPKAIVSDSGTHFSNKVIGTLLQKYAFNQNIDEAGLHRKLQFQELEELRQNAYDNASLYKEKTRSWHDKMVTRRVFEEGQEVLVFQSCFKNFPGKLRSRWYGPYKVRKVFPHGALEVEDPTSGKVIKVNGQRLKHYFKGIEMHCEEDLLVEDPIYQD